MEPQAEKHISLDIRTRILIGVIQHPTADPVANWGVEYFFRPVSLFAIFRYFPRSSEKKVAWACARFAKVLERRNAL